MNRRTRQMLGESLLVVILSLLLTWLLNKDLTSVHFALGVGPLIWLTLRYGGAVGFIMAAIVALLCPVVVKSDLSYWNSFVYQGVPMFSAALASLFARNTHRTLNNYRYSSTYLNISTASVLVVFVYYLSYWLIGRFLVNQISSNWFAMGDFWVKMLVSIVIIALLICLVAKFTPKLIIPSRSPYLSRKETSSLLND